MTTTTTTPAPGADQELYGIRAYLDLGGNGYAEAMLQDVFDAYREEVDRLLPDGVTWHPYVPEFVLPVGTVLPEGEEMKDLFREAWKAVVPRLEQIEDKVLEDIHPLPDQG